MRSHRYRIGLLFGLVAIAGLYLIFPLTTLFLLGKAKGLVGERNSGYLGAVSAPGEEVQALIADVNQKRHQAYEEIARRNGTSVNAVETLAWEKAVQNTNPGYFVEGPGARGKNKVLTRSDHFSTAAPYWNTRGLPRTPSRPCRRT